jgi:large subunit ribosomal protein L31
LEAPRDQRQPISAAGHRQPITGSRSPRPDHRQPVAPARWWRYTPALARPVGIGGASRRPPMKPGIHPEYHEITIIMTDGTEYKTRSCYGKPGDTLRLDIDPKSHPAWTGVQRMIDTGGQVAKFNKKFAGIGMKK